MSLFFEELKRRKVYRVAVGYIVVAAGMIQLASAVFPAWELPDWSLRLLIVLLLAGFPIALIVAWAFDITPSGIRAAEETAKGEVENRQLRRRNLYLLGVAGLAIALAAGFFLLPRVAAHKVDKSIAVLPFQNFSDQKANTYFADGIQDDILTALSRINDLKVISRTSVMGYRDTSRSAREIGESLGVATLLEGSVRSEGKRVRVNVQLINAQTDEHIWANEYDRDLTDVFAIQSDLAHEIVNALEAKLSPSEEARMTRKPTENGEAYLAFVEARNLYQPTNTERLKEAEQLFQRAIELDPNFALALAGYSHLESWMFHSIDPSSKRRTKARELAERALKREPDLPEAHLALGQCYYYGDLDYDRALSEFQIASAGLPNNTEVLLSVGAIQRRQGKWSESIANMEKAVRLNPKDSWLLQNLGISYWAVRKYEEADKTYDRLIQLAPATASPRILKGELFIAWKGDLSVLQTQLTLIKPGPDPEGITPQARIGLLLYQRKFSEALAQLEQLPGNTVRTVNDVQIPKSLWEGFCYHFLSEEEESWIAFEQARDFDQRRLRDLPDDASVHAQLGLIYAGLGRKEEAIREGKRAAELLPESKDAFAGPEITQALAQIYAWTGETDEAFKLLEHLLTVPAGITIPLLKLDPAWDPLRKDPRFERLLARQGAIA